MVEHKNKTASRPLNVWWKNISHGKDDGGFGENQTLRKQNYWLLAGQVSLVFVVFGILLVSEVTGSGFFLEIGRAFISGGLAVVVASFLNFIRNRTIEKNMVEEISGNLKVTVQETFKIIQHKIYPNQVYICDKRDGDKNLFNKKINDCMQKTTSFRFMSISGIYLLGKRLNQMKTNHDIDMQLLFQNPCDTKSLGHRAKQLELFEAKTVSSLQEEIIESVIRSYILQMKNSSFKIRLRFHNAPPLCRLEFSGADDLFVSYYKSQEGPSNWGPVAHYRHMQNDMENDVYRSFNYLFNLLWDSNGETELNFREVNSFNSPHDLVSALHTNDGDNCHDIFSELAVSRILERLLQEYMRGENYGHSEIAMTYDESTLLNNTLHSRILEWLDKGRLIVVTNEQNDGSCLLPHRFSKTHSEGLWHRVVHIELKNEEGKYFVWQRYDGRYEIPGGHVSWIAIQDRAETYEEAVQRELIEELNLLWNWQCLEDKCREILKDRQLIRIEEPFKNELGSTHGDNKEWVSVYGLTWKNAWNDPCKYKLSREGKNARWLSLEEIKALHETGAVLNAALKLFLQRHP